MLLLASGSPSSAPPKAKRGYCRVSGVLQRVGGQVLTQSLRSNTKPLVGASGTSSHENSTKNELRALLLGFSMPWV